MDKIVYHISFGGRLHGDFSVRVDPEAGIKDSVWNLVAHFIRVTFANWLGGEVNVSFFVVLHLVVLLLEVEYDFLI